MNCIFWHLGTTPPLPFSRLPKPFPASECFFFCLSHFLFSGSFQLPVSSAHPTLTDLTALFPSGSNSPGADLGTLPLIWPIFRWLCPAYGWKTIIIMLKRFFEVLVQGRSWIGTKKRSWGRRNWQNGHTKQSEPPSGLRDLNSYCALILFCC